MVYDKKEKIALGTFIFSVVAVLVLFLVIAVQNRITGQVTQEHEEINNTSVYAGESIEKEIKCEDSDGSTNYDLKGTLVYCDESGCFKKEDYCSGNNVIEWFCENKEGKSKEFECEFECDDGVCLTALKKYTSSGGIRRGGSSNGGGGGTSIVQTMPTIYELGQLSAETTLDASENEGIRFDISGTTYLLILNSVTGSQIIININGVQNSISIGEEKRIDLNSDGTNELYMKLRSINLVSGKAKLTLNLA